MYIQIINRNTGYVLGWLTTEHSASSQGIPIMVDHVGKVYGPNDRVISEHRELSWMYEGMVTAGDIIEKLILDVPKAIQESQEDYDKRIYLAKLFLTKGDNAV